MGNRKFGPTAAAHAREHEPQAYFLLRSLYAGPNHQTLFQLSVRSGLAPDTVAKRPRYYRQIKPWCTRARRGQSYVYSRVPGKTEKQVLREFKRRYQ